MTASAQTITLYAYRPQSIAGDPGTLISLADAIKACGPQLNGACAWLYTTDTCVMGQLAGDRITTIYQQATGLVEVDLSTVYEARLFTSTAELRWLAQEDGNGRAVLLTEEGGVPCPEAWESLAMPRDIVANENRYVLWGKHAGQSQAGWSTLSSGRIGTYWAPCAGVSKEKPYLIVITREYLSSENRPDGNCAVLDERFCALQAAQFTQDGEVQ